MKTEDIKNIARAWQQVQEKLTGNQHKIDHNKNGKIDAGDFEHLRSKKKKVGEDEEVEINPKMKTKKKTDTEMATEAKLSEGVTSRDAIDEISKDLAQRYYTKSYDAQRKAMNTMIDTEKARKPEKKKAYDDARATFRKRGKGSDMAAKRLAYKGKNEEAEQIDEISMDKATRTYAARKSQAQSAAHQGSMDYAKKQMAKARKTKAYMDKRESVEQVDEISKDLAGRYIKKAQIDTAHAGDQIATGSMGQMGASPDVKKGYEKQRQRGIAKLVRRRMGTSDAVRKLTGKARVAATEETNEWPIYARIKEARDAHMKGATPPEAIDSKASKGEKDFKAMHKVDDKRGMEDQSHDDVSKAGRVTKKAPGRNGDNKAGDKMQAPVDTTKG